MEGGHRNHLQELLNSHIDVIVHGSLSSEHWRATGFYEHPDANKRYILWQLLDSLNAQCNMPWVVFGDFNEILYSNKKLGEADREEKQLKAFRDCLNRCGLVDLRFVGQKFTCCNGRFNENRTKLRFDKIVANKEWMRHFTDARVFHSAMSISDYCLLKLSLSKRQNRRTFKKRFMFEAM